MYTVHTPFPCTAKMHRTTGACASVPPFSWRCQLYPAHLLLRNPVTSSQPRLELWLQVGILDVVWPVASIHEAVRRESCLSRCPRQNASHVPCHVLACAHCEGAMHIMPHASAHFFCRPLNRFWNRALQGGRAASRFHLWFRCNRLAADTGLARNPRNMPGIAKVWLCQQKGNEFSTNPHESSVTSH